jgi:hypothetical protein
LIGCGAGGASGLGRDGAKATSMPPLVVGGVNGGGGVGSSNSTAKTIACAASDSASGSLKRFT